MKLSNTVLDIELGSTRIKAVMLDEKHVPIASGSYEWENQLVDGIWTYSLDSVHLGLQACYADLAKNVETQFGQKLTNVGAIGVSGMMHGYACFIVCLTSSMAAYAFAKKRFFGRDKIFYLFLMTMIIPTESLLIPTFLIVKEMGLLNTFTGLTLPLYSAFGVILIRSFMKGLPDDLLEAADIDGCGEVRKFVTVVLPLIKPALISLTIFTFISAWGSLLWPLVTASGDMTTVTTAVANMKSNNHKTNYGAMMAASTIAFMPPFVLYLFLQKQFVEGIALSGIKG